MKKSQQNQDDLYLPENDWQAFRFVSGEMPAAEAADFEQRLLEEPPLVEAVNRAVDILAAWPSIESGVSATPSVNSIMVMRRQSGSFATALLMIAASLLLVAAIGFRWMSGDSEQTVASSKDETELASAWLEYSIDPDGDNLFLSDSVLLASGGEVDADEDDWIFSAVMAIETDSADLEGILF